jgi:hypothetical protein
VDISEIGCGAMDWINLAQDRDTWRVVVNTEMKFRFPCKCREILDILSEGRRLKKGSVRCRVVEIFPATDVALSHGLKQVCGEKQLRDSVLEKFRMTINLISFLSLKYISCFEPDSGAALFESRPGNPLY